MAYYTERHGLRKPIEHTYDISEEIYALIFKCCEKYFNNLAWRFPTECEDGCGCCGYDYVQLNTLLKYEIPELYRNHNGDIDIPPKAIPLPWEDDNMEPNYNQYALIDFIEFLSNNIRDVVQKDFHKYYSHFHMTILASNDIFNTFKSEINEIFKMTGLLYILTDEMHIERVIENSPLTPEIEVQIDGISEWGTRELLKDAINLYRTPCPPTRQDSVEKIWDALERLKTVYALPPEINKKKSAEKVVDAMSNGIEDFRKLFNDEFLALTTIGNTFRIRHHETDKIDIIDIRYYDYFFNRCLSLIALAIQYIK